MVGNSINKIKKRYNRIAPIYDIMENILEKSKMGVWRQNLWEHVREFIPKNGGNLLEVGVGTGRNIKYYPEDIIVYAIDFSEKMLQKAYIKKENNKKKKVKIRKMDIQQLKFPDNFFDIIVATCVFCSVPKPIQGFKELKRVCKSEGKIILLEHMRTDFEPWGKLMDIFNWVTLYTYGANINRRTIDAGLKVIEIKNLFLDIVREIVLEP